MGKIIIDLCGGTGFWSRPYKENGYTVLNVTHPDQDVKTWQGYKELPSVHGILFAPTCTHFSLARTTAKEPRDLEGAFELVEAGLKIIRYCRYHKDLKFWALENPVGYLRQLMGKPFITVDPCEYGANYTKRTDLWGYFNAPRKAQRKLTAEEAARCSINNRVLPALPEDYTLPNNFTRQQARRSMTDVNFANAFYKANK